MHRSTAQPRPTQMLDDVAKYRRVRSASMAIASPLSEEDTVVQSMPDASPTKWHLAHTTWFFEAFILTPHCAEYQPFDEQFHFLFNSYYESHGPRHTRADRGLLTRPSLKEVECYRQFVDEAMEQLLQRKPSAEIQKLLQIGLNHEQQHQELMVTDIKHLLFCNPIGPSYHREPDFQLSTSAAKKINWIEQPEGLYEIGATEQGFSYDNEGPRHRQYLRGYRLANHPISNAEWLDFINDGGYDNALLWLSDAWPLVQSETWQAPLYWQLRENDDWQEFTTAGWQPLDPARPVTHISFYEADAYARWAGKRLPTEAEWEVVAAEMNIAGDLAALASFHPQPVSDSENWFGGVWEWTASPYQPYPGYQTPDGALGEYNAKFMCNQMVLRGGSCATPAEHIRASYRNFFYPHCRWQFSGLRLADDAE